MPGGLHVEVTAGGHFFGPVLAFGIHQRDEIFSIGGVDKDYLVTIRRDSGTGGLSPRRGEGYRVPLLEIATIEATPRGVENEATGKGKVASPIAHSRPNFRLDDEILWTLLGRRLPGESSLPGSAFPPYERVVSAVPEDVAKAQCVGTLLRGKWAFPVPKGCSLGS